MSFLPSPEQQAFALHRVTVDLSAALLTTKAMGLNSGGKSFLCEPFYLTSKEVAYRFS